MRNVKATTIDSMKKSQLKFNELMTTDDKREYKELFQLFAQFDTDGSGSISLLEWKEAMKRFGHQATEQQIKDMLIENNIGLKSQITLFEFITLINKKKSETMGQEHNELVKAFRLFDKDLDGVLNAEELKAGLERYGESMRLEDLEILVEMADRDRDGSINFQEFSKIMTLK